MVKSGLKEQRALFEEVFSRYSKGLLVYAGEFIELPEDTEDIVSEVFANFWEKMDSVTGEAVKSYLFRSVRNRCLDYLSHLKVRSKYQEKILQEKSIGDENFDLFVESELERILYAAIDRLPPQKKKVFVMCKMEGKSYAEVGEELNISPKTVDKHLEIALKTLRRELAPYLCWIPFVSLLMDCLYL